MTLIPQKEYKQLSILLTLIFDISTFSYPFHNSAILLLISPAAPINADVSRVISDNVLVNGINDFLILSSDSK